jgi:hypothetical protein
MSLVVHLNQSEKMSRIFLNQIKSNVEEQAKQSFLAISFALVCCLAYSSALQMETTSSSETSVDFQRTTRRYTQNIELSIITTVKISNLAYISLFTQFLGTRGSVVG